MTTNSKSIQDNIHGIIEVPPLCVKIIDTHVFKRLKSLCQLGVTHHVYPGATHTRFEHSLGVMYLGGVYCDKLKVNYPDLISPKDKLCVQIGGLCHDLGHGPFSHLWEGFVRKVTKTSWSHETASIELLDMVLELNEEEVRAANLTEKDIIFIKELINGILPGKQGLEGRGQEKFFLYEIISNKITDIDVDKWDYFLRDCHGTGIKNKVFDMYRLMDNTRITEDPWVVGRTRLCYHEKMTSEVQDMWATRSNLHLKCYQHRVTKVVERMFLDMLEKADNYIHVSVEGQMFTLSQVHTDPRAYTNVTEDWILGQIKNQSDEGLEPAKRLLDRIFRRRLYRTVAEILDVALEKGKDLSSLEEKLKNISEQRYPNNPPDFCLSARLIKMGKSEENPVKKCIFYKKHKLDTHGDPKIPAEFILSEKSIEKRLVNAPEKTRISSIFVFCRDADCTEEARDSTRHFQQTFFPENEISFIES